MSSPSSTAVSSKPPPLSPKPNPEVVKRFSFTKKSEQAGSGSGSTVSSSEKGGDGSRPKDLPSFASSASSINDPGAAATTTKKSISSSDRPIEGGGGGGREDGAIKKEEERIDESTLFRSLEPAEVKCVDEAFDRLTSEVEVDPDADKRSAAPVATAEQVCLQYFKEVKLTSDVIIKSISTLYAT